MTVFFSYSRHEPYERYSAGYPITSAGIADAWISGPVLEDFSCPIDVIYTSPLARAKATAAVRGKSVDCPEIIVTNALQEDAASDEVLDFKENIISKAEDRQYRHIHFVTHQPVVATLGGAFSTSPGTIYVEKAEHWSAMMQKDTEILKILPVEERLYALQFENPKEYDELSKRYARLISLVQEYEGSLEELLNRLAQNEKSLNMPLPNRSRGR